MAARVYDDNPAVVAAAYTRKADGTIPFGKLVEVGSAAGDVKVTTGAAVSCLGVAAVDEAIYDKTGNSQYADEDAVIVKALTAGKIYYLYASADISEGDFVCCAASGDIAVYTPASGTNYEIVGIALDAISDDNWGRILVV